MKKYAHIAITAAFMSAILAPYVCRAQAPHLLFGEIRNADGSVPAADEISFQAHLITRPEGMISETHIGQTGLILLDNPSRLLWMIQCSDFPGKWAVGREVFIVFENNFTGDRKELYVTLNAEPYQDLGNVALPVRLSLFEALEKDGAILLHWRSEDEVDCLGFNILRSEQEAGPFERVNEGIIRSQGGVGITQDYFYTDTAPLRRGDYYYKLEEVSLSGMTTCFGPIHLHALSCSIPERFRLHQNHPNPFNGSTELRVDLLHPADVALEIYDIRGRFVATIFKGKLASGSHLFNWDGTNQAGLACPSGIYLCNIVAGREKAVRKIILAR